MKSTAMVTVMIHSEANVADLVKAVRDANLACKAFTTATLTLMECARLVTNLLSDGPDEIMAPALDHGTTSPPNISLWA